jgi:hypothetical protein
MTTIAKNMTLELWCNVSYDYEPAHRERAFGDHGPMLIVDKEHVTVESVMVLGADGKPVDIKHLLSKTDLDGLEEEILDGLKIEEAERRAEAREEDRALARMFGLADWQVEEAKSSRSQKEERRSGLFDFAVANMRGQFR